MQDCANKRLAVTGLAIDCQDTTRVCVCVGLLIDHMPGRRRKFGSSLAMGKTPPYNPGEAASTGLLSVRASPLSFCDTALASGRS